MDVANASSSAATQLIQKVLGASQQAQTDLGMKLAKISLASRIQAPPGTADASGSGGLVDGVA
jgi:hypothetical protein